MRTIHGLPKPPSYRGMPTGTIGKDYVSAGYRAPAQLLRKEVALTMDGSPSPPSPYEPRHRVRAGGEAAITL